MGQGAPEPSERAAFERWIQLRERAGLLVDFDGTLSAIVDEAGDARLLPGVGDALATLATRCAVVAVVSGRPVSFLLEHVGIPGVVLSGLYGLETARDGRVAEHPDAAPWRAVVDGVADDAERDAPQGVAVERKGLAMTLHVRQAPQSAAWAEAWAAEHAAATGLTVLASRRAFELRPPVATGKDTVVTDLAQGLAAACFVGDDRADLDAFSALDRLAADGVAVVKVAVESDEAPRELLTAADLIVAGAPGAARLLQWLASVASER